MWKGKLVLRPLIALGSTSEIKYAALAHALQLSGRDTQIITVKARSDVGEQPVEQETLLGARNRANHAALLVPDALLSIAIESGVFQREDGYVDIAVVLARFQTGEYCHVESEALPFPHDAVEETFRRGQQWTVGKVLQEWGRISRHDDPHLDLVSRSRLYFLSDALVRLFQVL